MPSRLTARGNPLLAAFALALALPGGLPAVRAETGWQLAALHGETIPPGPRVPVVAVIDTGIDLAYPAFAGKLWTNPEDGLHGWNFAEGTGDLADRAGHGTAVAGIIADIAPEARLMILKAGVATGAMNLDDVSRAIVYAVGHGADVVNLSITAPNAPPSLLAAVSYARRHGVVLVAAAGNAGTATSDLPGGLPGVIRVGALAADDAVPSFSNRNPDLVAPGVRVPTARAAGVPCERLAEIGAEDCSPEGAIALFTGTSFATAAVSGIAARLRGLAPFTGDAVEQALKSSARDLGEAGVDAASGAGAVQAEAALAALGAAPASPSMDDEPLARGAFIERLLAARGIPADAPIAANFVLDAVHSPYMKAIATAKSRGLIHGERFSPDRGISRAEALELADRLLRFPAGSPLLLPQDIVRDEQRDLLGRAFTAGIGEPWNNRELNRKLRADEAAELLVEIGRYDPARGPLY